MSDAIQYLSESGILLQPGAEKLIEDHESPDEAARFIRQHYTRMGEPVLAFPTSEELMEVLREMPLSTASAIAPSMPGVEEEAPLPGSPPGGPGARSKGEYRENRGTPQLHSDGDVELPYGPQGMLRWKPSAREYPAELEVEFDITDDSTCTGKLGDFVSYFNHRFEKIKEILERERRSSLGTLMPMKIALQKEHEFRDRDLQIIGIVRDVRVSSKKNVMLQLEDGTDELRVMISQKLADDISQIVPDEVIAVSGRMMPRTRRYPATVMARAVIRPDVLPGKRHNRAALPLYAAFMSDIHVGSNTFLHKQWDRFIQWINGRVEYEREIAASVKYLVIPGDVVDGIGVYPGHEDELDITDIFRQYEDIAQRLAEVPEHIKIIISPGNHDAVRMAEPQPAFIPEVTKIFEEHLPGATLLGNPFRARLHGVDVLAYHGKSMDDFITTMSRLTYDKPLEIMKEMLRRRHLVPIYGKKTPIAPEAQDHLVIDEIPDIFVTGHVHSAGIERYRGVLLLNASTWQDQTSYQRMLNFVPDYAKLPVVNLQTLQANLLDFNGNWN